MDVTDRDQVKSVFELTSPDVVLHFAAMTHVDGCELNPDKAVKINVNGTRNILKEFRKKIIYVSTDYVFDGQDGPYKEEDIIHPINVYGQTKLDGEILVKEMSSDYVILRTNVVWNIGGNFQASFADWLIRELTIGNPVRIVTDQYNNPTHTEALHSAIMELLNQDASGVYHYGSKNVLNRYEFARLIANVYELDESLIIPISTKELNQPAKRPLKSGLKTDKIQRDLGIQPTELVSDIEKMKMRSIA